MEPYTQSQVVKPPDTARDEALKQFISNVQSAKEILNLLVVHPDEVPNEVLSAAVAALKTAVLDAAPYVKPEDKEEHDALWKILSSDPLTRLRVPENIDAFQHSLNQVLKNSGLYELGTPSRIKEILVQIDIDEEGG